MPIRQGDRLAKKGMTSARRNRLRRTTRPSASTPWTWNTFLAKSNPTVVTFIADGPSRFVASMTTTLWHVRCRRAGAVHPITFGCWTRLPANLERARYHQYVGTADVLG